MSDAARRRMLQAMTAGWASWVTGTGAGASLGLGAAGCERTPPAPLAPSFPGKAADLLLHTERPPNLETPLHYFLHDRTPNEAFFVRWHLALVPLGVDLATYRLRVEGHVQRPLDLSVDELRTRFTPVELTAVNQCSGNGRADFAPRVPGVQWGKGALGNASWRGVRLAEVLERAGLQEGAREVSFHGLDKAPLPSVAEFEKSLALEHAQHEDVLLAYEMNGAPLPPLHGFPLRLIVPGHYSTYWVKALDRITVHAEPFEGYWMKKAYRIPTDERGDERPDALAKETRPIGRMTVRSLLVTPESGARLPAGKPCELQGIAFDGGTGIARVDVSTDGGQSFREARLDADLGRYSFRRFRLTWTPDAPGVHAILVRATSVGGEVQRPTPGWNRAGYLRNVIERTEVRVDA